MLSYAEGKSQLNDFNKNTIVKTDTGNKFMVIYYC